MKGLISISLYGDDPLYWRGGIENILLLPSIYPGWTMRFYIASSYHFDHPFMVALRHEVPGDLRRLHVELFHCGNSPDSRGMWWRFGAAASKEHDAIIIRDADSRINVREKAAVDAWIASGKSLHVMRDHPHHASWPILGGMWGIRGGVMPDMVQRCHAWRGSTTKLHDQFFLNEQVYAPLKAKGDVCEHGYGGEPFPDHPPYKGFVGEIIQPASREVAA